MLQSSDIEYTKTWDARTHLSALTRQHFISYVPWRWFMRTWEQCKLLSWPLLDKRKALSLARIPATLQQDQRNTCIVEHKNKISFSTRNHAYQSLNKIPPKHVLVSVLSTNDNNSIYIQYVYINILIIHVSKYKYIYNIIIYIYSIYIYVYSHNISI